MLCEDPRLVSLVSMLQSVSHALRDRSSEKLDWIISFSCCIDLELLNRSIYFTVARRTWDCAWAWMVIDHRGARISFGLRSEGKFLLAGDAKVITGQGQER